MPGGPPLVPFPVQEPTSPGGVGSPTLFPSHLQSASGGGDALSRYCHLSAPSSADLCIYQSVDAFIPAVFKRLALRVSPHCCCRCGGEESSPLQSQSEEDALLLSASLSRPQSRSPPPFLLPQSSPSNHNRPTASSLQQTPMQTRLQTFRQIRRQRW